MVMSPTMQAACIQLRNHLLPVVSQQLSWPSTLWPPSIELIATTTLQPIRRTQCSIHLGFSKLDFSDTVASCDHASKKEGSITGPQRYQASDKSRIGTMILLCVRCAIKKKIMYKVQ